MSEAMLVAVLALPALGAAGAALLSDRAGRFFGTGFAALAFVASLLLGAFSQPTGWFSYAPSASGAPPIVPWTSVDASWVPALDLRLHFGVDGVSYPLVVLTTLLTMLCCLYTLWHVPSRRDGVAERDHSRAGTLISLLLVVEVGMLGTFLALDLVLFFVFFEVVLLPMYAVIAGWGGERRRHAARKFALYTLFGSVLLLVGVFTVVVAAGTADLVTLTSGSVTLTRNTQLAAFTLLAIAFAVKSPLWPLHTWLPDAHTQAPTVGSVLLAGVLLKMGTYGLIRVAVGVAPEGARWASPLLAVLAVAAILVGCLVCLAQTELKRLIAYSSVGHMGFVLLGVATLTATGIQAALIGNVAHGIITGLLFFLAGAVKDRFHTGDLAVLGGLRERAPWLSGLLAFAAIASLGLPGLAGFWGEAFAVVAAFERGGAGWVTLGVLAAIGGALTAAYFLRMLRKVTHGAASPAVAAAPLPAVRISGMELAAWSPLVVLALLVGLVPAVVLGLSAAPVQSLIEVVTP